MISKKNLLIALFFSCASSIASASLTNDSSEINGQGLDVSPNTQNSSLYPVCPRPKWPDADCEHH